MQQLTRDQRPPAEAGFDTACNLDEVQLLLSGLKLTEQQQQHQQRTQQKYKKEIKAVAQVQLMLLLHGLGLMRNAGHSAAAVAVAQAVLEFNLSQPKVSSRRFFDHSTARLDVTMPQG